MDISNKFMKIFLFALLLILLAGCQEQKLDNSSKDPEKTVDQEFEDLKLNLKIGSEILKHEIKLHPPYILLIASEKGFERINTNLGMFFIALEDIKPFAAGYKIFLKIGNPYFAKFSGIRMSIEWGKEPPDISKLFEWEKSVKKKEVSFTEQLNPGCWTVVDITLSPATKDELGYLKLSDVTIENMSLQKNN